MANFPLTDVLSEVERQATAAGLDPRMAKALVLAENTGSGSLAGRQSYDGSAVSPKGASGIMQVMPATARGLQQAGFLPADWQHNPDDLSSQVQAGVAAMKEMTGRMKNPADLGELGSMYNGGSAGQAAYNSGKLDKLPAETTDYLNKLRRASMDLGGTATTTSNSSGPTSSSSRTTTRSTSFDPASLDSFVSAITSAAGTGGSIDQTMMMVKDQQTQQALLNDELVKAITTSGQMAGAAAAANATVLAAGQAKRSAILTSMNLDPVATQNEMMKAFDAVNKTDALLAEMKPEIDARMAVGFFDNPLEWLINQTRLPGMVQQYNGVLSTQNDATARYQQLASIAQTQQGISAATDADMTLRAGNAAADAAVAAAEATAAQLRAGGAGQAIRDQLALAQLTGQKIDLLGRATQLTKISQTESEGLSERATAKKAEEEQLTNINAMIVAAGGQPLSLPGFKGLPSAKKETLASVGTSQNFGKNFSESFEFIWNDGNRQKLAATGGAAVAAWLQGTAAAAGKAVADEQAAASRPGVGYNPKFNAKNALPEELNRLQAVYEGQAATNMRGASDFNPFKITYEIVAKEPVLKSNVLAAWINQYGPKGTEPMMATVDEEFVIKKMAESVATGKMSAGQAAKEVTDFYKVASAVTAKNNQWSLFGLSKPDKTYPVVVNGIGQTPAPIDLGDPSQVENALTRKVAYDRMLQNTGWRVYGSTP